jgi:uncharacterized protein (DUF302 family)
MMLLKVESTKDLNSVARSLESASQRHRFGVLGVHDLKAKLKEKGLGFGGDCLIYEVCNPQQAKKVLEASPEISTALPCRISVYRAGGKVTLATIRPTAMIDMFNTPELQAVAAEVEAEILAMMNEAAS